MSLVPKRLQFHPRPLADPKAIITGGNARFTVLSSGCIRMEWHPEGKFEDRPSKVFWYREQPVPVFTAKQRRNSITISTEKFSLRYDLTHGGFTGENLWVRLKKGKAQWKPGDKDAENLGGTASTLDGVKGACELENGLVSRKGISVVNDSKSLVFDENLWPTNRNHEKDAWDLYLFAYGADYHGCIQDFCALAGPVPLVPRWVLGNWWSRYWGYSDEELLGIMQEFRKRELPLSVCVIDMDWHVIKNPHTPGWTGYTWNKNFFPAPEKFLQRMHEEYNLKISLNLHPADGVHPHEMPYKQMARHMGINPGSGIPVSFDCTDQRFMDGYFRYLHHPHENMGIDFWWMDWQQGSECSMKGLHPLFWLNHLHFLDIARKETRPPVIFSRWAGLGNHRYPIGFSGDTVVSWEALAFQPYFTANAANVAYSWWSHDIGGHFWGVEDPELYTRWVQLGAFSPVLRLHTAKNRFQDRHPWVHGTEAFYVSRNALQLRHALVPYLYSMNRLTHEQALPLVRPMYWSHPERDEAYHCPNQYWFGTELIAAPFVSPAEPTIRQSRQVVWFPPGKWYGFFDGVYYEGNRWHAVYGRIEDIPVFAKAGAIIPLAGDGPINGTPNPEHIRIRIFAGEENNLELYEDDGQSSSSPKGGRCITPIAVRNTKTKLTLIKGKTQGRSSFLPRKRRWGVEIFNVNNPTLVKMVTSDKQKQINVDTSYNMDTGCLTVMTSELPTGTPFRLELTAAKGVEKNDDRFPERMHKVLHFFALHSNTKLAIYHQFVKKKVNPAQLREYIPKLTRAQQQCLCELLFEAGMEILQPTGQKSRRIVLWNNHRRRDIFAYSYKAYPQRHSILKPVPSFKVVTFDGRPRDGQFALVAGYPWHCVIDYAGTALIEKKGDE